GESLLRSLGYTGHGGLLVWGTGSDYPSFQQGGLPWTSCAKRQKWNLAGSAWPRQGERACPRRNHLPVFSRPVRVAGALVVVGQDLVGRGVQRVFSQRRRQPA